jgi:hypothetical protein
MERGMIYLPIELEDQKEKILKMVNKIVLESPICYGDPVLVTTENDDIKIKFFKKEEIEKDIIEMKKTENEIMMMHI